MKGKKQKANIGFKNNSDEVTVMEKGKINRMIVDTSGRIYFRIPNFAFLDKHEKTNAHDDKPSTVEMKPETFGPEAFGLDPNNPDYSKIGNVHFDVHLDSEIGKEQARVTIDTGRNLFALLSRNPSEFMQKDVTLYDEKDNPVGNLSLDEFKKKLNSAEAQKFIDHKTHFDFEINLSLYCGEFEAGGNEYLCFDLPNGNFYEADRVLIPSNGYKLKESDNPGMYAFSTRDYPVLKATGHFPFNTDLDSHVPDLRVQPISMKEFKNDVDKLKLFEFDSVSFTVPKSAVVPMGSYSMVRFPVGSAYEGSVAFIPNNGDVSVRPGPVSGVENSDNKYVITCKSDDMFRVGSERNRYQNRSVSGGELRKALAGAKYEEFFPNKRAMKKYDKAYASM